jgi:hypothetical protein
MKKQQAKICKKIFDEIINSYKDEINNIYLKKIEPIQIKEYFILEKLHNRVNLIESTITNKTQAKIANTIIKEIGKFTLKLLSKIKHKKI